MENEYDIGLITNLTSNIARGVIIGTNEPFEIKMREEVKQSLSRYMVVAINLDHTDFIYRE
ncbi:hypothetical protein LMC00_02665 [Limosilactobacillus reuteri]|uniref:hypothetical protein n=1 Tax=Limosilactobacillus reuteri TaxID=1598 RepID=UPI001E51CD58|nr:hypothetical protein [Limosilactobacillus reuteri]MCC4394855.1 hypothetical protein [Limosilactobacillus reuteri]MCC4402301.1 hypothetical protein [Limosilactobacillus reuteri]